MFKKWCSIIYVLLSAGLLMVACAGPATPQPAPTAPPVIVKETVIVQGTPQVVERTVVVQPTAAPTTAVPATAPPKQSKVVVVRSAGGSFGQALLTAFFSGFEAETGIEVRYSPGYGTAAQIKAQRDAGNIEWDVALQGPADAYRNGDDGYFEVFDYSKIDPAILANIPKELQRKYGPVNHISGRVLAYRTDKFPGDTGPKSWADFWDVTKFPGKRSLVTGFRGEADVEFALLADGVPMDKLYPLDADRAFAKLDKIKPYIVKWWDGGESVDMLVSGDVVMASVWNGRVQPAIDAGEKIKIVWDGGLITTADWCVMKNAPNRENAYKFINYALRPENQAKLSEILPYGTSNTQALTKLKPTTVANLPTAPDHYNKMFLLNAEFYISQYKDGKRFSEWVTDLWPKWVAK